MLAKKNTMIEGLDEDCDCPEEEEELSMMKTRNVAQKNASLCQEYAIAT